MMIKRLLSVLIFLISLTIKGQELPPIESFMDEGAPVEATQNTGK